MATEKTYKVKFGIENNYVVEDVTKSQIVKVIAVQGANFAPTIVSNLPATGDSSKLYLTEKSHTSQSASGNPISISITEGAGAIDSLKLDGDTYQQSYTGVNLCDSQNMYIASGTGVTLTHESDGSITINGYNTGNYLNIRVNATALFQTHVGENITVSVIEISGEGKWSNFGIKTPATNLGPTVYKSSGQSSYTGVLQESSTGEYWCDLYCNVADVRNFVNYRVKLQAELGSTATSYEPYVGGIPSPNPDYPQNINVVTGTQTVSVNGTNYTVNLGDIELCKLGDYQDYIYPDGNDWKVHKATGQTTYDGSNDEVWTKSNSTANQLFIGRAVGMSKDGNVTVVAKSDKFTYIARDVIYAQSKIGFTTQTTGDGYAAIRVGLGLDSTTNTVALFRAWLGENITTVYYPLETATDTTITDTNLISQLEAVRTASLQASNTITNTATGSNLAGDLEITYHGYNPTNRYDKWIWLDTGYEQL